MPSLKIGSIRVFSMRPDQRENGPEPGETVVRVDRANPVLGNPHMLHNQNDPAERDRVIAAYIVDSEADWLRNGPRRRAIEALAARVAAGERVALACWCKPRACHGDWIAERVLGRIAERSAMRTEPQCVKRLLIKRVGDDHLATAADVSHAKAVCEQASALTLAK